MYYEEYLYICFFSQLIFANSKSIYYLENADQYCVNFEVGKVCKKN